MYFCAYRLKEISRLIPAVKHALGKHRIEEAVDGDADLLAQHLVLELGVLGHFQYVRILQHRFESKGHHTFTVHYIDFVSGGDLQEQQVNRVGVETGGLGVYTHTFR